MTNLIYGVDPTKEVTSLMVRDAMIKCFTEAHSKILNEMNQYTESISEEELENSKKLDIEIQIKKIFEKNKSNFEKPTKQDIIMACDELAKFAENFRQPEVVKKHYEEIMTLVSKLKT